MESLPRGLELEGGRDFLVSGLHHGLSINPRKLKTQQREFKIVELDNLLRLPRLLRSKLPMQRCWYRFGRSLCWDKRLFSLIRKKHSNGSPANHPNKPEETGRSCSASSQDRANSLLARPSPRHPRHSLADSCTSGSQGGLQADCIGSCCLKEAARQKHKKLDSCA